MPEAKFLRDLPDLPPELRAVLEIRRHSGNPWRPHEALLVARFSGYEPSEPYPGTTSLPWPGICHLGHPCAPRLGTLLKGSRACRHASHRGEADYSRGSQTKPLALRARTDLPDGVAAVLSIPRTKGRGFTQSEARVVAEFVGFKPSAAYPGAQDKKWAGVCVKEGHPCDPTLDKMLRGFSPCRDCTLTTQRAATVAKCEVLAKERGDEILDSGVIMTPGGKQGMIPMMALTVKFSCGHTSGDLAVRAGNYKNRNSRGCVTCNPNTLARGINEIARVRPELAFEMAPPWDPWKITAAQNFKVGWLCPECNHYWEATPGSRHLLDSGCPVCNHGVGGYSEALPGTLYIVRGPSKMTGELLIKVGITNVAKRRLALHSRQGLSTSLALLTWSDGEVAARLERVWLRDVRKRLPKNLHARKLDLLDGYREAVIDVPEARAVVGSFLSLASSESNETLSEYWVVEGAFSGKDFESGNGTHHSPIAT